MFGQHQNRYRDGGAKKQVGSQRDHRFHVVVIDQVFPNFLLRTATVENAGEADNCRTAFAGKVVKCMEHKGKIGLGLGRQHTGGRKAVIVDQGGVITADPLH